MSSLQFSVCYRALGSMYSGSVSAYSRPLPHGGSRIPGPGGLGASSGEHRVPELRPSPCSLVKCPLHVLRLCSFQRRITCDKSSPSTQLTLREKDFFFPFLPQETFFFDDLSEASYFLGKKPNDTVSSQLQSCCRFSKLRQRQPLE